MFGEAQTSDTAQPASSSAAHDFGMFGEAHSNGDAQRPASGKVVDGGVFGKAQTSGTAQPATTSQPIAAQTVSPCRQPLAADDF
eukprot:989382-Prorocentrum_minimum.AAC.1